MLKADRQAKKYLENEYAQLQKSIWGLYNGGSTTFEVGCIVAVLEDQLSQVENALARLGIGAYGFCEICGEPIAPERLVALPSATTCMSCNGSQQGRFRRH